MGTLYDAFHNESKRKELMNDIDNLQKDYATLPELQIYNQDPEVRKILYNAAIDTGEIEEPDQGLFGELADDFMLAANRGMRGIVNSLGDEKAVKFFDEVLEDNPRWLPPSERGVLGSIGGSIGNFLGHPTVMLFCIVIVVVCCFVFAGKIKKLTRRFTKTFLDGFVNLKEKIVSVKFRGFFSMLKMIAVLIAPFLLEIMSLAAVIVITAWLHQECDWNLWGSIFVAGCVAHIPFVGKIFAVVAVVQTWNWNPLLAILTFGWHYFIFYMAIKEKEKEQNNISDNIIEAKLPRKTTQTREAIEAPKVEEFPNTVITCPACGEMMVVPKSAYGCKVECVCGHKWVWE
jgi:hypothetical protein